MTLNKLLHLRFAQQCSFSHTIMRILLPTLPSDVWPHIVRFLTPSDLTSLSLTSISLHRLITSQYLFRYVYLTRKQTPPSKTAWSNLYRRSRAILRTPTLLSNTPFENNTLALHIVAVIGDHLFLTDGIKLFAFPAGWTVQVDQLCADKIHLCAVPMPDSLGIVYDLGGERQSAQGQRFAKFVTLQLETGEIKSTISIPVGLHGIYALERAPFAMHPARAVFAGGFDAKFLVYFIDFGRELRIVDRSSGACVRTVYMTGSLLHHSFRALVRGGGSCGSNQFVVTDVVEDMGIGLDDKRRVSITSLEGDIHYIDVERNSELLDIVRGECNVLAWRVKRDGEVTMWRMQNGARNSKWPVSIIATAGSSLLHTTTEFCIREDGDVLFLLPRGTMSGSDIHVDGRVIRLEFKNGQLVCVERLIGALNTVVNRWNWATICVGGRLILAGVLSRGFFAGFDMVEGRRTWSVKCSEEVSDAAVIGEHYLVAIGKNGRVYAWHFGAFCKQKGGEFSVGDCVPLFSENKTAACGSALE